MNRITRGRALVLEVCRHLLVRTALLLVMPVVASAQSSRAGTAADTSAGVAGTVVDTNSKGLANVDVMVDATVRARTNGGGGFFIVGLRPGFHLVRFRRFGLKPVTAGVTLTDSAVTDVDAILELLPHTLPQVVVQDKRGEIIEGPPDFVKRVQTGMGHYITRAQIDRAHPYQTTDLLRSIPGVVLTYDHNGEVTGAVNTRGINTLLGSDTGSPEMQGAAGGASSNAGASCPGGMAVYIDGVYTPTGPDKLSVLNEIGTGSIVGMEIYRSASEIPVTLPGPVPLCGAILIWTR